MACLFVQADVMFSSYRNYNFYFKNKKVLYMLNKICLRLAVLFF